MVTAEQTATWVTLNMDIPKPVFEMDGSRFQTLDDFYDEVSQVLIPGADWGRNLDALNDILRGGFGTPAGGFVLKWRHSTLSRARLGYPATCRWLERQLATCHPSNRSRVQAQLEAARTGQGRTLFDILVEIIEAHTAGGEEEQDGVVLILE